MTSKGLFSPVCMIPNLLDIGLLFASDSHSVHTTPLLNESGIVWEKSIILFITLFQFIGTAPATAPFVMQAALLSHFMYGAYYPRGGASEIAFHSIPIIRRSGGKVLVRAPVTKILIDSEGKAAGRF